MTNKPTPKGHEMVAGKILIILLCAAAPIIAILGAMDWVRW